MEIILASNSPRRRALLTEYGINFKVIPPKNEETHPQNVSVYEYVEILAREKATEVYNDNGGIVLGADTIVTLNGKIFGKPTSKEDAFNTLKLLSNKTHEVITGYAIISKDFEFVSHEITKVTFNNLSDSLILDYVNTGSPLDKAGSYGIQDNFNLVKEIEGSLTNVIGLPVEKIAEILREKL